MSAQVAKGVSEAGACVVLVTDTPGDSDDDAFPFSVVRQPSGAKLRELFVWADVIWHHQPCFGMLRRAMRFPDNMGLTCHTWLPSDRKKPLRNLMLRRFKARHGVSRAIASHLPNSSGVLPNSFDPSTFKLLRDMPPSPMKLGCVARLVTDKGVDLLLDALSIVHEKRADLVCSIVGEGPESGNLSAKVNALGLNQMVEFLPFMEPLKLADFYRSCSFSIIPSRWEEPFGLVALESIACGTPVIAANHGGLPEAVGECGLLFAPGDATDLADKIGTLVDGGVTLRETLLKGREKHLLQFQPQVQTAAYMKALERISMGGRS